MKKLFSIILCSILLFNLVSCSKSEEVNSDSSSTKKATNNMGFPTVDGLNSNRVNISGLNPTINPKLKWKSQNSSVNSKINLVSNGTSLFAAGDEGLYILNMSSGSSSILDKDLRYIDSKMLFENNILYFSDDEVFYALDIKLNKYKWAADIMHPVGSLPFISKNLIIFGDITKGIYALDKATGSLVWAKTLTNGIDFLGGIAGDEVSLFISPADDNFMCLETSTGKTKWVFLGDDCVKGVPTVGGNIVYFSDVCGKIHAVDRLTGKLIWKKQYNSSLNIPHLLVSDSLVIATGFSTKFNTPSNTFIGLDKITGSQKWVIEDKEGLNITTNRISAPLLINDKHFIIGHRIGVSLFEVATGKQIWNVNNFTGTQQKLSPLAPNSNILINGKRIYFTGFDGNVYSYGW
jgi:outer membrane protein assembly factor BamB